MRYVAAYLLATLGGSKSPSSEDIEKILSSVGIEAEADKVKKVVSELKGKNIHEVISEGQKKLASVPGVGTAVTASGTSTAASAAPEKAAAAAASTTAAAAKKEEKKEESESESDEDMGFGLFD